MLPIPKKYISAKEGCQGNLSEAAQPDLEKGFAKIEKEVIGPGRHEEFRRILHHLEEEYLK
jgi:hypothetical protein